MDQLYGIIDKIPIDPEKLKKYPFLSQIQEKFGVPQKVSAIAIILLSFLVIANGICSGLLATFFGFLLPAYESLKALETPSPLDDKKWLTYWVIYGCFSILEFFADIILFWLPFYYLIKVGFLTWCMWPNNDNNGALFVYERVVRPYFLKNEKKIDAMLAKGKEKAKSLAKDVMNGEHQD